MTKQMESLFTTVLTEGGLLSTDLLQRVTEGDASLEGLSPESYGLEEGTRLNEETNRAWTEAAKLWRDFQKKSEALGEDHHAIAMTRSLWLLPLFQLLGFEDLATVPTQEIEGKEYPISHTWKQVPFHFVGYRMSIDKRTAGTQSAAKISPHGMVQEFLNRSDDHLWAFVSNGYRLRLLRDNVSLTRQAYVEFDLQAMMEGELYADFSLFWMLCHRSRFDAERPESFWLERWSQTSQQMGTRLLDQLRDGVTLAIESLGQGFLEHRANQALREKLQTGELSGQDYYRQLLRTVYKLLFLFVAESRGVLLVRQSDELTPEEQNRHKRYKEHYSLFRFRRIAESQRGTAHSDQWRALSLVMEKLGSDEGYAPLALPALGSFLWRPQDSTPDLQGSELSNLHFLKAINALAFTVDGNVRRYVDYRNLGSEELGSVFESLLELHPTLDASNAKFSLSSAAGNERKTTGSYYTPTSLVQALLDSALDPVLDEAENKSEPESAILDLKICDPACGSGHFLTAAAHRVARRLARVRSQGDEPAPLEVRRALRDVIGRCIYGVDINPMAVELCKVSLWIEALEPGKPLSFLEHHIQCGNSLLGATPALMAKGIPDDAFQAIEGDDKDVVKALKARNKEECQARKKAQGTMFVEAVAEKAVSYNTAATSMQQLELDFSNNINAVHEKEQQWQKLQMSPECQDAKLLADAWCAAFVFPKDAEHQAAAVTDALWHQMGHGREGVPVATLEQVDKLSEQYQFFHWHLRFPQVFSVPEGKEKAENSDTGWNSGFDVVLGNPPWDLLRFNESEFFAAKHPDVADASTAAKRKKFIAKLEQSYPDDFRFYKDALRDMEGQNSFVRSGSTYPLCGVGRVNLYALFAEKARQIVSKNGWGGLLLPSGIATDDSTKLFFQTLVESGELRSFYDFENRGALFQAVHRSYKFGLLTFSKWSDLKGNSEFVFFAHGVDDLKDQGRVFFLSAEDIFLLNPETKTCPIFRSRRDAEITKKIYRLFPVIKKSEWEFHLTRLINQSDDSSKFQTESSDGLLPLYEAKYFHHYDHRWVTHEDGNDRPLSEDEKSNPLFFINPRFWYPAEDVEKRFGKKWKHPWAFAWRDIARSTDERSFIAGVIPSFAIPNTAKVILPPRKYFSSFPLFVANVGSFIFDFVARQKIGGTHMSSFIVEQLPVVPPSLFHSKQGWLGGVLGGWLQKRVLELSYTAWDLKSFASEYDFEGAPFRWDESRRFLIRCELDAAFFHLYGIDRDDVDYIMETFPIVKRKDEAAYGEYRTKRVILEIYDEMTSAIQSGTPYRTRLDPPPADPSLTHPPRQSEEVHS